MLVCPGDDSAQASVFAASLRFKLQIKLIIAPSSSTLTPGQPIVAFSLERQAPWQANWTTKFSVHVFSDALPLDKQSGRDREVNTNNQINQPWKDARKKGEIERMNQRNRYESKKVKLK